MWLFDGGTITPPLQYPGSDQPISVSGDDSYFGTVMDSELITAPELVGAIGLVHSGKVDTDPVEWFKVSLGGKMVFIPQRRLVEDISWDEIYRAGAVYGIDDEGTFPIGTPVPQTSKVTINGVSYRVRLMTGASTDPIRYTSTGGTRDINYRGNSEWERVMVRLANGEWGSLSSEQLGVSRGAGYQTWVQESSTNGYKVQRGVNDVEDLWVRSGLQKDTYKHYRGWRPLLEAIGG